MLCVGRWITECDARAKQADGGIYRVSRNAPRFEDAIGVVAPPLIFQNREAVFMPRQNPEPERAAVDRFHGPHVLVDGIWIRARTRVEGIDRDHGRLARLHVAGTC